MVEGHELRRKRGAATVLALLVSFLFGYGPAAAGFQERSARLGPTELVKQGPALRTTVRAPADEPEPDALILPPPSSIWTKLVSVRRGGDAPQLVETPAPQKRPLAYRARAPPAA